MRRSLALIAALTTPLLAVVACDAQPAPTKGIVTEKEYEPAKTCPRTPLKARATGKKKLRSTVRSCTPKKECYELDIKADKTGEEIELCDRAAFNALTEGDRYSSAINYATIGDPT